MTVAALRIAMFDGFELERLEERRSVRTVGPLPCNSLRGRMPCRSRPRVASSGSVSAASVVGEQAATFGLGEAAPDAVRLAHAQRELETVLAHVALRADVLRVRLARLALFAPLRATTAGRTTRTPVLGTPPSNAMFHE